MWDFTDWQADCHPYRLEKDGSMSVPDQSTIALLQQISKRLDGLEQRVATLTDAANRVPAMTGMLTDIVDEAARREGGAELDERVRATGHLLLKLSEPRTLHALERVLARMETVDDMLAKAEELPNLVAMAVDSFDEAARQSFPFDQSEERYSMYALEAYGLPRIYWHGMLRGRI